MNKASISDARHIAQYAQDNISFDEATRLCKTLGPKLNVYQTSVLVDWVYRFAKCTD